MTLLRNFWMDDQGQDLIEYTLLLGFVALASAALFISAVAASRVSGRRLRASSPTPTLSPANRLAVVGGSLLTAGFPLSADEAGDPGGARWRVQRRPRHARVGQTPSGRLLSKTRRSGEQCL